MTADEGQTWDPLLMVGVGALVLLAIDLARDPRKGRRFRFTARGLSDSTIGTLLGERLGTLLTPKQ